MRAGQHAGLAIAAAIGLLLAAAPASAQALGGDRLMEEWGGKTLTARLANGSVAQISFRQDGTIAASGAVNDTGIWKTAADGYCTRWKALNGGQERCFTVVQNRDKYDVKNATGAYAGTFEALR